MDRSAVHAALADPHRLAIADALALGDLAPTEIGTQLDLPSNLLAHHLRVLEAAGVIKRRRSQGDRRRAYVRLRWSNPIVAATVRAGRALEAPRVVFVCTQNSARSQMAAAALAAKSSVPVASAGTHPAAAVHPLALATLEDAGLAPLAPHPALLDTVEQRGDLLVAVCDAAHEELAAAGREHLHWSIKDPVGADRRKPFAKAFAAIEPRVDRLAAALSQEGRP